MADNRRPRRARNADNPGEYRLAIRSRESEVDPGGELHIEIYITGYGDIQDSKLTFYPPPYFIDEERSSVAYDMRLEEGNVRFGAKKLPFNAITNNVGLVMTWSGLHISNALNWQKPTYYFDVDAFDSTREDKDLRGIATEYSLGGYAPLEFTLRVSEGAPSGSHSLRFFFTYFNGSAWLIDNRVTTILVRSWVRKYERLAVTAGLVLAVVAGGIALLNASLNIWDHKDLIRSLLSFLLQAVL